MSRWRHFLQKYEVLFKVEWAVMFAYRSESVIWMIGSFIQPLVSLSVWLSISANASVEGYGVRDYVLYFLGVLLVNRLTTSWDVWEIDNDIREGTFSAKLLRPFHPVHWSIVQNLVYKAFFALMMIPAWALFAWFWPLLRLQTDAGMIVLAAIAIVGASMIRFLIGYEFGLLSLWTNRSITLYMLYEGVHLFLAGRIAPLAMFPEGIAKLASWLPFYATVGFPVDLMTGKLSGQTELIRQGFWQQLIWIIVLFVLFRWEWVRGMRKYSAAGG